MSAVLSNRNYVRETVMSSHEADVVGSSLSLCRVSSSGQILDTRHAPPGDPNLWRIESIPFRLT